MVLLRRLLFAASALGLTTLFAVGAEREKAEPKVVSYYRDIRPIIQANCQGCHQPARAQGGLVLTSYAGLLKAGDSGEVGILPGKPEESYLIEQIVPHGDQAAAMPKGGKPLTDREVRLLTNWIGQGAKNDTPTGLDPVVDGEHPPVYLAPPVIPAVTFSPDSAMLAVAGYHEVLLHKADGSELLARLVGLSERIQALAFSPDGKWLAVAGGSPARFGEVQVWETGRKKLILSVPATFDTVYGVSWSPDGSKIAFGCSDNTLRAIDATTGKQVLFQGAHNDWVLDTVFSTAGTHLVSVSRDRSMKLTEVATQRFVDNITSITPGALKGGLQAVDRHPRKDELLIGGSDGTPKVYQMFRNKKRVIGDDFNHIQSYKALPGRIFAVKYSADGKHIVVGSSLDRQGEVRVYKTVTRPEDLQVIVATLSAQSSFGLSSLTFLETAQNKGEMVSKFEGQKGAVYTLAFRPDGKVVASAGFDGLVRLNDPKTGKLIKEFVPVPLSKDAKDQ
jgi:WD40 repeat protein